MRRICFYGNCQAGILQMTYRNRVAARNGDETLWIPAWLPLDPLHEEFLKTSDLLIEQVSVMPFTCDIGAYRERTRLHQFPTVGMGFLWPFGNQPHPRNAPIDFRPQGPYELNDGDSFLNRRMMGSFDASTLLDEYVNGDPFGSSDRLDRFYELYVGQQRSLDERTGFDFWGEMSNRFQHEHLFMTFSHPGLDFSRLFISQVLSRFVCSRTDAADVVDGLCRSPFPSGELPVHPVIARHFSLRWAGEGRRYVTFTGERVTHAEYFDRYLKFDWNRALADLLYRAQDTAEADIDALIQQLVDCLATAADSALGWRVLGNLCMKRTRFTEARNAYRSALDIEGDSADVLLQFALCNLNLGDPQGARELIVRAIALCPRDPEILLASSRIFDRLGSMDEALLAARTACLLSPNYPPYVDHLIQLLLRSDRAVEAEALARAALDDSPRSAGLSRALARLLDQTGKSDEARAICEALLAQDGTDLEALRILAHSLMRQGRHVEAEFQLRSGLSVRHDPELLNMLGQSLGSQLRLKEALASVAEAVELVPNHAYYVSHLADINERLGEVEACVSLSKRATELQPQDDGLRMALIRRQRLTPIAASAVLATGSP